MVREVAAGLAKLVEEAGVLASAEAVVAEVVETGVGVAVEAGGAAFETSAS